MGSGQVIKGGRKMEQLKIKPNLNPNSYVQVMKAHCSACGKQIVEAEYRNLGEYNRKRTKWVSAIKECPYCKAKYKDDERKPIAWHRGLSDYSAEAQNGTFFVFRWGKAWRWSFRYRNEETPRAENTGVAFSKDVAQRVCEKHKEWR